MCEKRGRAGGTVDYNTGVYTDIYKCTRSGQEKRREKRECEESVCCDQDGFGCMSLAQFMPRCVAFSGFTKRP